MVKSTNKIKSAPPLNNSPELPPEIKIPLKRGKNQLLFLFQPITESAFAHKHYPVGESD